MQKFWRFALWGLVVAVIAGASAWLGATTALRQSLKNHDQEVAASSFPGMDAVDDFRCPRHLTKIVEIRGVEDGFDRSNSEPQRLHPLLADLDYFSFIASRTKSEMSIRDYDEAGRDKMLYDYVVFPENVKDGAIIMRLRVSGGHQTDGWTFFGEGFLKNEEHFKVQDQYSVGLELTSVLWSSPDNRESVRQAKFSDFTGVFSSNEASTFSDSFQYSANKERLMIIQAQDDHQIDFMAIISCVEKPFKSGTTFTEARSEYLSPEWSFLSCNVNYRRICDAVAGDMACHEELPLACYKPATETGTDILPDFSENLFLQSRAERYFTSGEVKITPQIAGMDLGSRTKADQYCQENFGPEWTVLKFHEAGGSAVFSKSQIPDGTRVWIDVLGSPHANCWTEE